MLKNLPKPIIEINPTNKKIKKSNVSKNILLIKNYYLFYLNKKLAINKSLKKQE